MRQRLFTTYMEKPVGVSTVCAYNNNDETWFKIHTKVSKLETASHQKSYKPLNFL